MLRPRPAGALVAVILRARQPRAWHGMYCSRTVGQAACRPSMPIRPLGIQPPRSGRATCLACRTKSGQRLSSRRSVCPPPAVECAAAGHPGQR